eukprot:gene35385-43631_t
MGSVVSSVENGKVSSETVPLPTLPPIISIQNTSSILSQVVQNTDNLILSLFSDQPTANFLKVSLLYRGSVDGFSAEAFHKKVDGHKSTLSIIRDTENSVFGAYTDAFWDNFSGYKPSPKSFLFSLMRNNVITAEKYNKIDGDKDIMCAADKLCTFGQGEDLFVASDCNLNAISHSMLGVSYGVAGAGGSLSRVTNFTVLEMEVFEVEWGIAPAPPPQPRIPPLPTSSSGADSGATTVVDGIAAPLLTESITSTPSIQVDESALKMSALTLEDPSPKAATAELISTGLGVTFGVNSGSEKLCVAMPVSSPKP